MGVEMKTGIVLEGGGLRGAYTAGVLDAFIENGITFDYGNGVSAGAGTLSNFISGNVGRSKEACLCPRKDSYYGMREFFRSGKFMNLDKLYGEFLYKEPAFDFDAYFANPMEREYTATNCITGRAEYLTDDGTVERYVQISKASCALPIISRPVIMDDCYYMDGSVTDPLPVGRAFEKGCDKVLVVSTKGPGMEPSDLKKYIWFMKLIYPKNFHRFYEAVKVRVPLVLNSYSNIEILEKEGKALMLHPQKVAIGHMEKNTDKIKALYDEGYSYTIEHIGEIKQFLEQA